MGSVFCGTLVSVVLQSSVDDGESTVPCKQTVTICIPFEGMVDKQCISLCLKQQPVPIVSVPSEEGRVLL